MKFRRIEKSYVKSYWIAHRRYKRSGNVIDLFNMLVACGNFKEEITSNFYSNLITEQSYDLKYRFLSLMYTKAQELFYELQCDINEMKLDIIYKEKGV